MSRYEHLGSPLRLGALELPNRIVMAPMGTGYADEHHLPTDRLIAYHVARARGGVGLNIVEHTAVHPLGLTGPRMLAILDDKTVPHFRRLVDAVHEAGGRIALQLQHGGRQADADVIGQPPLAPSAVPTGRDKRLPREMTVREIREVVKAYGDAAWRAKQAGCDGVEVHMAHGYLGCSFLSPYLNQRTDDYGGDTNRRTRFAAEVIQAIRKRCSEAFPVWCRVSGDEFVPGGQCLAEMQRLAPLLQKLGYCAIHVSACIGETSRYASAPYLVPEGHLLYLAQGISQVVTVPVIGVGGLRDPEVAESALANGRCDAVALGRALLADPAWSRKVLAGREEDVTPCIYCNLGCLDRRHSPEGLCECVTNPATGHEVDWPDWPDGPPAAVTKHVLVIGGGPAGMTAAAVAARRGHRVTLWEASPTLGGRLALSACYDRSHVFERLVDHMAGQLDEAGVEVAWQQRADLFKVAALKPDTIVVATGSRPAEAAEALPEGIEGEACSAAEYLQNPAMDLDELVAVVGGDEIGCAAALELSRRGRQVMLFEQEEQPGPGMAAAVREFTLEQIAAQPIQVFAGCQVTGAVDGRVTALVRGEERQEFPPASVLIALGRRSVDPFSQSRQRLDIPLRVIGDAVEPRTLHDAIWEGAQVGREI